MPKDFKPPTGPMGDAAAGKADATSTGPASNQKTTAG
jgi:hypothetical protein